MILKVLAFLLYLQGLQAINQTCSFIDPCPDHAECDSLTNYCVCKAGYIGNCNTEADPIGEYPQIVTMTTNSTHFFYMKPIEVNQFIEFTLTICRERDKSNVPVLLYAWDQNGINSQYLITNTVSPPLKVSFDYPCNILTTKFVTFGVQPNGESQMLIIAIGQNREPVTLTINISQKLVLGLTFYFFIMIGMVAFVSVISLMSAIFFYIRRRRRRNGNWRNSISISNPNHRHNIDHFEAYMPSVPALERSGQKSDCPICLQQISKRQEVRVTPCNHIFHTPCLDSWCVQNINCPVCRSDFSIDKIEDIKKVVVINDKKRHRDYQDKWEQTIEIQLQRVDEHPIQYLKEPML